MAFLLLGMHLFKEFVQEGNFLNLTKLWTHCVQEESRLTSQMQKTNDEENQALGVHVKKRKEIRNNNTKKNRISVRDHKKDVSNIICFNC